MMKEIIILEVHLGGLELGLGKDWILGFGGRGTLGILWFPGTPLDYFKDWIS